MGMRGATSRLISADVHDPVPAVDQGLPDLTQGSRMIPDKFLAHGKDGKDKGQAGGLCHTSARSSR